MRRTFALSILSLVTTLPAAAVDPDLLAGLKARAIGPATMSGRVAAVEALVSDPDTLYVGAATGGLWKSTDGALTWKPLFDDQPVAAIGAVSVHRRHTDIVWVGTGEGNPRNSASVGNGVYKSLDGGRTWAHLGLEDSERIHRIVLHPTDPEVAYVAALGKTWGEHPQRGVFKTTDGGRTWEKVLYVDETTGASELVMDPRNPHKLFATLWQHRRWPWFFASGGPGSGIFVTHDGGESWKKLTPEDGLPEGDLGRIGLAIAPSDPSIVYALVEAQGKTNRLLRSDDGGRTWQERADSAAQKIGNRPFYYSDIRVDPADPNRVYSLWSRVSVSEDGGKTWRILVPFNPVHPDHHDLWIDPNNPRFLIDGNDGGVYLSRDRGETWRYVRNLPFSQFYHVRVDDETPFNVYGGLQDNGSWKGPSTVWENAGIRDYHWSEVHFGDGFDTVPDPEDPSRGYAMSQDGYVSRWSLRTGERKSIRPAPDRSVPPAEEGLRFNWNAAIALDPFDSRTVYYGSQFVHKSKDRGDSWEVISPDLTTDEGEWQRQAKSGGLTPDVTGAENFTSLVSIAPSPVAKGVLWVGSDDGRIHLTTDGGDSWKSVEGNVKGVPAHTWVPHIEPSRFEAGEAYVVFDNHRRADWTPYVYRTRDFGKTWQSLAADNLRGYALVIVQDPVDRDLLFLGTEFGLWASLDGGDTWMPWKHGVPTVSVMDLAIQKRHGALVLGTHGRGVFVLDDLHPLREMSEETLASPLHLYSLRPAQQYYVAQTGSARFPGHGEFRGENQPYGARLYFSLNLPDLPHPDEDKERSRKAARREVRTAGGGDGPAEKAEEPKVKIRISDPAGRLLRTLEPKVHQGLNRVVWDLRAEAFDGVPDEDDEEPKGPEVPAGAYHITVELAEHSREASLEILPDPRFEHTARDRDERWAAVQRIGALQEIAASAVERIQELRSDLDRIRGKRRSLRPEELEDEDDELFTAARELETALEKLETRLWNPPGTKGYTPESDAWRRIDRARFLLGRSWSAPTAAQRTYIDRAAAQLAELLPEINRFFAEDVAAFREKVVASQIQLLPALEALEMPGEEPSGPRTR